MLWEIHRKVLVNSPHCALCFVSFCPAFTTVLVGGGLYICQKKISDPRKGFILRKGLTLMIGTQKKIGVAKKMLLSMIESMQKSELVKKEKIDFHFKSVEMLCERHRAPASLPLPTAQGDGPPSRRCGGTLAGGNVVAQRHW